MAEIKENVLNPELLLTVLWDKVVLQSGQEKYTLQRDKLIEKKVSYPGEIYKYFIYLWVVAIMKGLISNLGY